MGKLKKIEGEEVSTKDLKNMYFADFLENVPKNVKLISKIVVNDYCFEWNEEQTAIIKYPINFYDSDGFPDYEKVDAEKERMTVYDFINNWWGLDECDIEDFTFYYY